MGSLKEASRIVVRGVTFPIRLVKKILGGIVSGVTYGGYKNPVNALGVMVKGLFVAMAFELAAIVLLLPVAFVAGSLAPVSVGASIVFFLAYAKYVLGKIGTYTSVHNDAAVKVKEVTGG